MIHQFEPDWRALAVEAVDSLYGYTMEFSPNPDEHAEQYGHMERTLQGAFDRQKAKDWRHDMMPDMPAGYDETIQEEPGKRNQSYSQAGNLELSHRIVGLVAPHWSKQTQGIATTIVRGFMDRMLTRMWDDICSFHHKFGLDYNGPPRELPEDMDLFRTLFMAEELAEYAGIDEKGLVQYIKDALAKGPAQVDTIQRREDKFDALIDLVYVALGTAYLRGLNFAEGWRRVQRANMAKRRVERDLAGSKRGSAFDVVKPEGWRPPSHTDLVGVLEQPAEEGPVQHNLF